jgi:Uma2 family endonuclease
MSTARKRQPPAQEDPFFYGFRYVTRVLPDGQEEIEEVPLTEDDALHPQEGDHIAGNDPHTIDVGYLRNVFLALLATTVGAVVLSDTLVAWNVRGLRPMSPDIAVIFGVRRRRPWTTFDVAEEGVAPELIVEVTSPSTRNNDLNRKLDRYYRAGVNFYVIVDQVSVRRGRRRLRILGYRHGRRGFVRLRLNRQRRLWLQTVGCWLGVAEGQVVCYDAQGQRIEDLPVERERRIAAEAQAQAEAQARAAAEQRAQAEAQARAAAEERVRQLEEQLRRRDEDS